MIPPKLYETQWVKFDDKLIHRVFLFMKGGMFAYWLVAEEDGDEAFGFVNLGDDQNAEWGYFSFEDIKKNGAKELPQSREFPMTFRDIQIPIEVLRNAYYKSVGLARNENPIV